MKNKAFGEFMKQLQRLDADKEQIVRSAIHEFGKYDFPYASQRRICEVGGFTNAALLRQFNNLDELYLECVSTCYAQLHAQLTEFHLNTQETLEENLLRLHCCWQNFFRVRPEMLRIFIGARVAPPGLESRLDVIYNTQFTNCLREKLRELVCFYVSDSTQKQAFLLDTFVKLLESITVGAELQKSDLYPENFENWLHVQEKLFKRIICMCLHGLDSAQVEALARAYAE